jgi:hypothetical protein
LENESDVGNFPRIEKLYKLGLRIQFLYDEALITAEKQRLLKRNNKNKNKNKKKILSIKFNKLKKN